jgi:hypothetical protein
MWSQKTPRKKHLTELVLGVHDALHGSFTYPPRGVYKAILVSRLAMDAVYEHIQAVLSRDRAAPCWDLEIV